MDQFLDDLFNPVLDQLSDARSLAASIKGTETDFEELLSRPSVLASRIKGGGKGVGGVGSHQVRIPICLVVPRYVCTYVYIATYFCRFSADEHSEPHVRVVQLQSDGQLTTVNDTRIDITAVLTNAFGTIVQRARSRIIGRCYNGAGIYAGAYL